MSQQVSSATTARTVAGLVTEALDYLVEAMTTLDQAYRRARGDNPECTGLNGHGDVVFVLMHLDIMALMILEWERDSQRLVNEPSQAYVLDQCKRLERLRDNTLNAYMAL